MDRSRKSQIASEREAEKNGLTSGEKLQRRGGRTHAHSNVTLVWQRGMERMGEGAWGL